MTIEVPELMRDLPVCPVRKLPIPWFVSMVDGKPEFRLADGRKLWQAIRGDQCWVCGKKLKNTVVFVTGPTGAINRITSEPPSHRECAEYSVKACPFLSRPKMVRREDGLPEGTVEAPGLVIKENPGISCLWFCGQFKIRQFPDGILFSLPDPFRADWWSEGRKATRLDVIESLNTAYAAIEPVAAKESPEALLDAKKALKLAMKYIPD